MHIVPICRQMFVQKLVPHYTFGRTDIIHTSIPIVVY